MPKVKNASKTKTSKRVLPANDSSDLGDAIIPVLEPTEVDGIAPVKIQPHEELDPDVLEALNASRLRKKKTPSPSDLDYIPELDRDFSFDE